ncbi:hypothetical protein GOZ96_05010 [Agrobacterium vitis]|uniref:Uncharacterized protein n=1 Tax=Agrobacterium vitis TaxID=373 RepID=A0A7J4WXJ5_AGRVI|nr:hypothetical protein DXT89_26750 [Agrobacterium vitis]MUZ95949.1 hypothetical protein [Agrobacterium vitis]
MTWDDMMRMGDEATVKIAADRDFGQRTKHLEPRLWEALRLEMQYRLRKATGEPDAIVTFQFGPVDNANSGENR